MKTVTLKPSMKAPFRWVLERQILALLEEARADQHATRGVCACLLINPVLVKRSDADPGRDLAEFPYDLVCVFFPEKEAEKVRKIAAKIRHDETVMRAADAGLLARGENAKVEA